MGLSSALVALGACGSANSLAGSIQAYTDLSYDRVNIRVTGDVLVVTYVRKNNDSVANITIDAKTAPNLAKGQPFGLSGADFLTGVKISRVTAPTAANPNSDDKFPDVTAGALTMEQASLTLGAHVSGTFSFTFAQGSNYKGTIPVGQEIHGVFGGNISK